MDATPEKLPKIIIVAGPTAAGKTGFAIELARKVDGEIVGADSMQIYRRMDIGTAKPTAVEQAAVAHHMIDVVDPDGAFDAATYATMATDVIGRIMARGRPVFVVGGTGFYIKALIYGLFAEGPGDPAVRHRLTQQAADEGVDALHRRLATIDPEAAGKIHPNDTYRIVRALEVYAVTGEPMSVYQRRHGFRRARFDTLELGLTWPRSILYDRINRRVDAMMADGFLDEVRQLRAEGYGSDLKSMQSLGYRHLGAVIDGDATLDQAVHTLKRDHRRYAKRQLTWFGARPAIHWLSPEQTTAAGDRVEAFLE